MGTADEPVRIAQGVVGEVLGDELVLLNLETGHYYSLNATGRRIWTLVGEAEDPASLPQRLAEEFGIPIERARRDLSVFLSTLEDRGLVTKA
mgnify:CR=1 FL=1